MENRHHDALRRIAQAERNLAGEPVAFHLVVTFGGPEIMHPTWDPSWSVPSEHTIDDLIELGLLRASGPRGAATRAFMLTMAGRQAAQTIDAKFSGSSLKPRAPELPEILAWLIAVRRDQPSCFELPQRLLDRAVSEGFVAQTARAALARSILQLLSEGYLTGTTHAFDQANDEQVLATTEDLTLTMKAYTQHPDLEPAASEERASAPGDPAAEEAPADMGEPLTVAVLWAHSDPAWSQAETQAWLDTVWTFTSLLRRNGFDAELDLFSGHLPIDWARFGPRAIRKSDVVLVAVSPMWKRVWDGDHDPSRNAGAVGEANTLRGLFQEDQRAFLERVHPVVLPGRSPKDVPTELRATSRWAEVTELTDAGIEDLVRLLNRDAAYPRPPIGPRRRLGARGVPPRVDEA